MRATGDTSISVLTVLFAISRPSIRRRLGRKPAKRREAIKRALDTAPL